MTSVQCNRLNVRRGSDLSEVVGVRVVLDQPRGDKSLSPHGVKTDRTSRDDLLLLMACTDFVSSDEKGLGRIRIHESATHGIDAAKFDRQVSAA